MSEEIDKLVYSIDGDIGPLRSKFAAIEQDARATGQRLAQSIGSGIAPVAGQQFFSSTQAGQAQLAALSRTLNDVNFQAVASGRAVALTGHAFEEMGGHAEISTRHTRLLLFELLRGEWQNIPQSLATVALGLTGISAAGLLATAAMSAIPIAIVAAVATSIASFKELEGQIRATGMASGATMDEANAAAQRVARGSPTLTLGTARGVVGATMRGGVPLDIAEPAAAAAPGFARASGKDVTGAAGDLNTLLRDLGTTLEPFNREWNLLSAAQEHQVEVLVKSGQAHDAQRLVIEAANQRFKELEQETGIVTRAWTGVSKIFSEFGDALSRELGLRRLTIDEQIAQLQKSLAVPAVPILGDENTIPQVPGYTVPLGAPQSGRGSVTLNLADQQARQDAQSKITALTQQKADEDEAARKAVIAARDRELTDTGLKLADSFSLQDAQAERLNERLDSLEGAFRGTNEQYARFLSENADALASGDATALATKAAWEQILTLITKGVQAQRELTGVGPAPEAATKEVKAIQDRAAAYGVASAARSDFLAKAAIEQQFTANEYDSNIRLSGAIRIRSAAYDELAAKQRAAFTDVFGPGGAIGQAQFAGAGAQRVLEATPGGPAQVQQTEAYNRALTETKALQDWITTQPGKVQNYWQAYLNGIVDELTKLFAISNRLSADTAFQKLFTQGGSIEAGTFAVQRGAVMTDAARQGPVATMQQQNVTSALDAARSFATSNPGASDEQLRTIYERTLEINSALSDQATDQKLITNAREQDFDLAKANLEYQAAVGGRLEVMRSKELADLEARHTLEQMGVDLTTQAGQAQLKSYERQSEAIHALQADTRELENRERSFERVGTQAADSISSHFEDFAIKGGHVRDAIKGIEQDLLHMAYQIAINEPLRALFQAGANSLFGVMNGGASMAGGIPSTGTEWMTGGTPVDISGFGLKGGGEVPWPPRRRAQSGILVGESGPEIFQPSGPGRVLPASESRRMIGQNGAPQTHVTQILNIHPDVSGIARGEVMRMLPMIRDMTVGAVQSAHQRGQIRLS